MLGALRHRVFFGSGGTLFLKETKQKPTCQQSSHNNRSCEKKNATSATPAAIEKLLDRVPDDSVQPSGSSHNAALHKLPRLGQQISFHERHLCDLGEEAVLQCQQICFVLGTTEKVPPDYLLLNPKP
jgi:hypothetical protein